MAARTLSAPETVTVDAFGGGLNYRADPKDIAPDEWSGCNGWRPVSGTAEVAEGWAIVNAGSWLPVLNLVIGVVPDLMQKGSILLIVRHSITEVVRIFRMTSVGTASEVFVSGAPAKSDGTRVVTTTFVQGLQLIACGLTTAGSNSIVVYDGTTFAIVTNAGMSPYITAAAGHVIRAVTGYTPVQAHQIKVSDAGDYLTWTPTPGNSADGFEVVGHGDIIGLVPWGSGFIIFTQERLFLASATGGEPPFTVEMLEERGNNLQLAGNSALIVPTAVGVVYDGIDDLYRVGSGPLSPKSGQFFRENALGGFRALLYDRLRAEVRKLLSTQLAAVGLNGAWWRQTVPGTYDYQVIAEPEAASLPRYYLARFADGTVLIDSPVQLAATVDSKDFIGARPTEQDQVLGIKVQWEPLTDVGTDRLLVQVSTRNHFNALLGATGLETAPTFVTVGTLAPGQTELHARPAPGKITRWRFVQSSGKVRVRGFSFQRQRGPARRT